MTSRDRPTRKLSKEDLLRLREEQKQKELEDKVKERLANSQRFKARVRKLSQAARASFTEADLGLEA